MKRYLLNALGALALSAPADGSGAECRGLRAEAGTPNCTTAASSDAAPGTPGYRIWKHTDSAVCRAFTTYLDRLPRVDRSLACDLDTRLAGVGIARPNWVEVDIHDYWDVLYAVETSLAPASRGGQTLLAARLGDEPLRDDGAYSIAFDTWRRNYAANVQAGYIKPRLRIATLTLSPPDLTTTVLAYTPERDSTAECRKRRADRAGLPGEQIGEHIFPYDPAQRELRHIVSSEVVVSSRLPYSAVVFDGRAYFIGVGTGGQVGGFTVEFSRIERYGGDGPQDPLYAGYHLCGFSLSGDSASDRSGEARIDR